MKKFLIILFMFSFFNKSVSKTNSEKLAYEF